ncbi:MAG: methyltransferase domain-containing protein [Myxococcales bacterium]|nr:methyltransferase domain-containing protein [Myxococcales bacterium]USN50272.1 MAG: methyltransferase domain-containing protein [Myxococcales bacterium]
MFQQNPFRMIGTFAPSSKFLAQAMIRPICSQSSQRILEVGAGTGAITKYLAKRMAHSSHLDVVEIVPAFARLLKLRYNKANIDIFCEDVLKLHNYDSYDVIISSLPFNSLPSSLTKALIEHLIKLAKDGASFSFFEYKGLSRLVSAFLNEDALVRYRETRHHIDQFIHEYQNDEAIVKINIPPALVHYLSIDKNGA